MQKKLSKNKLTKKREKRPTVVCSAFVEMNKKFLFVLDRKFKTWRVPGGRPEWGEKTEDALKREMMEEINVEIINPKFLGFGEDIQYHYGHKENKSRVLLYFHTIIKKQPIVDEKEAEEYKWVNFSEIKKEKNKEGALTDFFKKNPKLKL